MAEGQSLPEMLVWQLGSPIDFTGVVIGACIVILVLCAYFALENGLATAFLKFARCVQIKFLRKRK